MFEEWDKGLIRRIFGPEVGEYVSGNIVLQGDHLRIIVDEKCKELWQIFEDEDYEELTLDNCLQIAKDNLGYTGHGIVLVLSESFLSGTIYRYGNCPNCKEWEVAGKMHGFA